MKTMKRRLAFAALFMALFTGTAAARDNLAVLPFTGSVGEEGETIAELFSFSKELNEAFVLIPRTSISQAISAELKFAFSSGMTDPDTIATIGKQLGAKYVVAGNIANMGNRNLLIISILKIDNLQQVAGDYQTYRRIEEIQGKLPAMAQNIITSIRIDSSKFEKLAVPPVALGSSNIDTRIADTLAQILSINLIRSGKYAVYPRTATLEQVQAEYKTQLSGVVADENIVGIGRGDNPQIVLSVIARRLGNRNMFNASLINLESGAMVLGESVNYNTLDDGITIMESLAQKLNGISTKEPVSTFGYGALNLAFGLGSFIQGDISGGVTTLLSYGAAIGLICWELTLDYKDDFAGIPGIVGLGVVGFAVVYGFIRPVVFNNNRALAEIIDGTRLTVAPTESGGAAIRLSYTVKF